MRFRRGMTIAQRAWILGLIFTLTLVSFPAKPTSAQDSAARNRSSVRPQDVSGTFSANAYELLSQAAQRERAAQWAEALQLYQKGQQSWPQLPAFQQGSRRCEVHLDLVRRYSDVSFRQSLTSLTPRGALDLYREVLHTIQNHYVDAIDLDHLVNHGTERLELALEDAVFLRSHVPGISGDQAAEVQAQLATLKRSNIRTPEEAIRVVQQAAHLFSRNLGVRTTPVVLEYVVGASSALDTHTSYLTADALGDLYAQIDGNFVGVGVEVRADAEGLLVLGVVPQSPAAEQGLRPGDQILQIDGARLAGMSTDQAARLLKGPNGSLVEVRIRRRGNRMDHTVVLRRREVVVKSINDARMLDRGQGIAYIQLTGFQKSTAQELDAVLWQLHREGMNALILDVRGNPGGLLTSAVEVSDRFVSQGSILSTRGRAAGQTMRYSAGHPERTWRMPLVLLIDGDSASASEIVAACLADHRRATLVGQNSYGKGEVQSIFPLTSTGAGLRLTTARFYSPQGRPLSKVGVRPDITVSQRGYLADRFQAGSEEDVQLREALRVAAQKIVRP